MKYNERYKPGISLYHIMSIGIIILVAGLIVLVTTIVIRPLIAGPALSIVYTDTTSSGAFTLQGETKRATEISIDDRIIPLLVDGAFQAPMTAPPGISTYTVVATDRFGSRTTQSFSLWRPVNEYETIEALHHYRHDDTLAEDDVGGASDSEEVALSE